MCFEQRIGDEMVPAHRQQRCTGLDDAERVLFDCCCHRVGVVRVDHEVPIIDDRQRFKRVKTERKGLEFRQLYRGLTNGTRPQTAAGPVGDRGVIRHARDSHVHSGQIAAIAAAQEGRRATIGHLCPAALILFRPECEIAEIVRHHFAPSIACRCAIQSRMARPKSFWLFGFSIVSSAA